ncbi:MAG TPA: hypothetical protein VEX66_16510 [Microlunatus sp.]|nr:hypothetical protein [Microlunatus sp.]
MATERIDLLYQHRVDPRYPAQMQAWINR